MSCFKNLRVFYINSILDEILYALLNPIFVIYMLNAGLTQMQLGTLMAIYFLLPTVLMPIVSAVADVWSRKKVAMLCFSLFPFAYLLMYYGSSYHTFLLAILLMGAGSTANTSFTAWMMDEIKRHYGEHAWVEHTSRIEKYGKVSFVLASLTAFVFLFRMSEIKGDVTRILRYLWIIAIVIESSNLLNIALAEEAVVRKKIAKLKMKERLRGILKAYGQAIRTIRSSAMLKYLMLSFLLYTAAYSILFVGFFPYIKSVLAIKEQFFNLIYLASSTIAILLYHYNSRIVAKMKGEIRAIIFVELIVLFLIFILLFNVSSLLALFLLVLIMGIEVGTTPIYNSLINKPIPSKMRSTLLSFMAVPAGIMGAFASLLYGFVAQNCGMTAVLLLVFALACLGVVPLFIILRMDTKT